MIENSVIWFRFVEELKQTIEPLSAEEKANQQDAKEVDESVEVEEMEDVD